MCRSVVAVSALGLVLAAGACASSPPPAPAPRAEPAAERPEVARRPIVEPRALPADDPLGRAAAATVARQLEAYNAHDVERFVAAYADSITVYNLGDTVGVRGKAALRKSTTEWFARAPQVRSEVLNRMVLGPFVVSHERLSGAPAGTPLEVVGIFEVRDNLIRRVWFIPPPPRIE